MTSYQLMVTPGLSGLFNMQYDLKLFYDFEKGIIPSTLRIYSWRPKCISLGYAQKVDQLIETEKAKELGWEVVKRPTGGGIVFHNEAEVTYSLVTAIDNPILPEGLVASYKKISEAVARGLKLLGIDVQITNYKHQITNNTQIPKSKFRNPLCFALTNNYEISVDGKKIVGSAQKRGRRAMLQQGSIFVRRTPPEDFSVLKQQYNNIDAVSVEEVLGREVSFEELSEALLKGFKEELGVEFKT